MSCRRVPAAICFATFVLFVLKISVNPDDRKKKIKVPDLTSRETDLSLR